MPPVTGWPPPYEVPGEPPPVWGQPPNWPPGGPPWTEVPGMPPPIVEVPGNGPPNVRIPYMPGQPGGPPPFIPGEPGHRPYMPGEPGSGPYPYSPGSPTGGGGDWPYIPPNPTNPGGNPNWPYIPPNPTNPGGGRPGYPPFGRGNPQPPSYTGARWYDGPGYEGYPETAHNLVGGPAELYQGPRTSYIPPARRTGPGNARVFAKRYDPPSIHKSHARSNNYPDYSHTIHGGPSN